MRNQPLELVEKHTHWSSPGQDCEPRTGDALKWETGQDTHGQQARVDDADARSLPYTFVVPVQGPVIGCLWVLTFSPRGAAGVLERARPACPLPCRSAVGASRNHDTRPRRRAVALGRRGEGEVGDGTA